MKKVFIVGAAFYHQFLEMFQARGYEVVATMEEADIVQFTGGADIAPRFYGQHPHPATSVQPRRDDEEFKAYIKALNLGKFLAGVCRGGQLINSLAGGSMYQHVDGHGVYGTHDMLDLETGERIPVSSVHHQMMIKGADGIVLGVSDEMRSPVKHKASVVDEVLELLQVEDDEEEIEAIYYPSVKGFCYQPHPEFVSEGHPCRNWYFNKLEELYETSIGASGAV